MQEKLIEALSGLSALKNNLPTSDPLEAVWVQNYHEILELIKDAGYETQRFEVPANQVNSIEYTAGVVEWGQPPVTRFTPERYVSRSLLLTKIDTVLGFFELKSSKQPIGFHGTRSQT